MWFSDSGTHDAQNVSITTTGSPGQVRVTADLIFGSTAIGLLIIIYSLTDDLDTHYHFAQVDQSQVDLIILWDYQEVSIKSLSML